MKKRLPRREITRSDAERALYVTGCTIALDALRARLEKGYEAAQKSPKARARWIVLATRATHIIALMARASPEAGVRFMETALCAWYASLQWPGDVPVAEALANVERHGLRIDEPERA
jgi:hypothetical protein